MAGKQGSTLMTLLMTHLKPATQTLLTMAQGAPTAVQGQIPMLLLQLQHKASWPGQPVARRRLDHPWAPSCSHPWQPYFNANPAGLCRTAQVRAFASQTRQAASTAAAKDGLFIDQSAVQRLKQLQAQQPAGTQLCLRIEVEGGGCSGYQYKFKLDSSQPADADRVFEVEGARVVVDNTSYELLKGSRVEFEDTLMRRAFVVGANPNSEASCGCGSSFAAKMPKIERKRRPA